MAFRFAAVGDLHLEKLETIFEEHVQQILDMLDRVQRYCMDNGISTIIQLGDVCDTAYPRQSTINRLIKQIRKYPKIMHYFILGNHDYSSTEENSLETTQLLSDLKAVPNLKVYSKPDKVKIDGVDCWMAPYPYRAAPKNNRPMLCFGHFEIKGSKRDNGQTIKDGIPRESLGTRNFWVLGHLHLYQPGDRAVFGGTLLQYNFGEPLPKGFLDVTAKMKNGKLSVKYSFIKVKPVYELRNVRIECDKDLAKVTDEPGVFFKLQVKNDFRLPPSFLLNHPQIVKAPQYYKDDAEAKSLEVDELVLDVGPYTKSERATLGLKSFLIENFKMNKDQIEVARSIVKEIEKGL